SRTHRPLEMGMLRTRGMPILSVAPGPGRRPKVTLCPAAAPQGLLRRVSCLPILKTDSIADTGRILRRNVKAVAVFRNLGGTQDLLPFTSLLEGILIRRHDAPARSTFEAKGLNGSLVAYVASSGAVVDRHEFLLVCCRALDCPGVYAQKI